MSDKELLELAAKAAGYSVEWVERRVARIGAFKQLQHERRDGFVMAGKEWNPLTDDGDALRLSVELGLSIRIAKKAGFTWVNGFEGATPHSDNPHEATRRAITRAAAEIGKEMS